jgi:hypothetical protein
MSAGAFLAVVACASCSAKDEARPDEPPVPFGREIRSPPHAEDAGPIDHGAPSDVYPAPHPDAPQVTSLGGPILSHPKVVAITFPGDPYAEEIERFVTALPKSSYWGSVTSEYGVGPLTARAPIRVRDAAPAKLDDDAIRAWLAAHLDGSDPAWGAADSETIYAIYVPPGTEVAADHWGKGCLDFAGYHWETKIGATPVAYAVLPRCQSFSDVHGFDVVTAATSHELVETATDPLPDTRPAYAAVDADHMVWALFPLSEVGDMCALTAGANVRPPDLDYVVQRSWSNAEARAHHDPCVPAPAKRPYFNSVPVLDDAVKIAMVKKPADTKGVKIEIGETKTIDLVLFSDGATDGPWIVEVKDLAAANGRPPQLGLDLDRTYGVNGEKLHLTITALRTGQSGGAEFMVISKLDGRANVWFGFVAN